MPKIHATLSASGSHRWLACPGSIRLCEGIVSPSSKYAEEGQAAHKLAEHCLVNKVMAKKFLGKTITINNNKYEVTEEMVEAVQLYIGTIIVDFKQAQLLHQSPDLIVEHQFNLNWLYPGLFGTNDCKVGIPFGLLRIYDFKYGAGVPVEVENNSQMLYYALGAAHNEAYEEIELVIVQPRAPHSKGPIRRWTLSTSELNKWGREVLLPGAIATTKPNAVLKAGRHCTFCPAMAICPEQSKLAMTVAKGVFSEVPSMPPEPRTMDYRQLKKILDASDLVEAWLKACRAHVYALLENGVAKPEELGYKIVMGGSSRSWKDEKDAEKYLLALLDDEAHTKKLVSPAQAEKLLKGKEAKQVIASMVNVSRGKALVSASDPREALVPAIAAFTEVVDI